MADQEESSRVVQVLPTADTLGFPACNADHTRRVRGEAKGPTLAGSVWIARFSPTSSRVRGSATTLRKNIFILKNDGFRLVKYPASRVGAGGVKDRGGNASHDPQVRDLQLPSSRSHAPGRLHCHGLR